MFVSRPLFARQLAFSLLALCASFAAGADWKPISITPADMGIDLPAGAVRPGGGAVISTRNPQGERVLARIHCHVGDGVMALLPDGQLVPRKAGEFQPSSEKFLPEDRKALAARLVAAEFPGFKSKQTNHYVYIYDTSEEFALATSRILETMLPGVALHGKAQQIAVRDPETPLVVVMFKDEAAFQKHQAMPQGVVAYYHSVSNRVFMYEQSHLADARPDLAVQQALSTIAHEGAHQILHNIGVQQRLSIWPLWLSEGLAEYFAPTIAGERLRWKGAGVVNDMRMFELEQYLKSRAADKPDGQMVAQTALAARLRSTGYATAWGITHYLAKNKRVEFNGFVKQMSGLGPFESAGPIVAPGVVRENLALFQEAFGDNLAEIETRVVLHLRKQPYTDPFAGQPHFVASLEAPGAKRPTRLVNTFHSRALAEKWLAETLQQLDAADRPRAKTALQLFPNRAAAEAFARQAGGR